MRDPRQTQPWYREPWPWLLMAGPLAAVANDDPLVADNDYKEGLAINRVLERDRAASRDGYRAQVLFSEDRTRVRVYLTATSNVLPERLALRLVHPTRAELDRTVGLKATQAGWYEGAVDKLEGVARDGRLTGQRQGAEGAAVMLQPRG